jgi:diguanylate cyclase (GGDEF)-like protein/PAS domain S-box-containing protein
MLMEPRGANPDVESLVAQSRAGVYVVQDGRFVYANPRLAEIFGFDLPTLYALPSVLELVSEADRPRVVETMRQRISGEVDAVQYTWRGVRRDGTAVDVEVLANRIEYGGRPAVGGTMLDATDRLLRERELVERESRLRSLIESTQDVVFTCDFDGVITSINPAGEQLAVFGAGSTIGRSILDAVEPGTRDATRGLLRGIRTGERDGTYEVPLVTPDGPRMLELTLRVVLREGEPVEIVGIGRDVTERKRRERALHNLTLEDELTGLYNRRGFLTLAERHLKLAIRKKVGVFLLFCDLDGLKQINDTHGHAQGDRALADTARLLRQSFRSADIIARLGGDEFTVFPLEAAGESADLLLGRLAEHIDAFNAEAGRPYRLTVSVGIARFDPGSAWTIQDLLDEADRHLYDAKRRRA